MTIEKTSGLLPGMAEWSERTPPDPVSPRASSAVRVAKFVALRNELEEIKIPHQSERIAWIVGHPVEACWHYYPHLFFRAPSKLSRTVIERVWATILHGGNQSVGVVRGAGKSTVVRCLTQLASLCGLLRYVVIFAATGLKASAMISDMMTEFVRNGRLDEDFGNVTRPYTALRGITQRAFAQTYGGSRTYIEQKTNFLRYPEIEDYVANGALVQSMGIKSGFLGLVHGAYRPDFVICDDIQDINKARSDKYVSELERVVRQGVEGLGSTGNPLRVVQLATCTRKDDYSDRILSPELYPEYSGIRIGLVENWGVSSARALWARYCDIWRQCQRNGDKTFGEATKYYIDNRAAMDDGVAVTDPNFYVDPEVSTIQHAWNMRLKMGDDGYFAQVENSPVTLSAKQYKITPKLVASRLNGLNRCECPNGTVGVFGFSDVGADKCRWCVIAIAPGGRICVVDYGVAPERGVVAPKNATDQQLKEGIWRAQALVCDRISSAAYTEHGTGRVLRVHAVGFDRGYHPDDVTSFCIRRARSYPFVLIACRGTGERQWNKQRKNVLIDSYNARLVRSASTGAEFLATRVDSWKEVLQRSFLGPDPEAPSSCSLWGSDVLRHMEYAESICSEVLLDKGVGINGGEWWKWSLRVGGENHYFDATVGALALAGYYRIYTSNAPGDVRPPPEQPPQTSAPCAPHPAAPGRAMAARRQRPAMDRSWL